MKNEIQNIVRLCRHKLVDLARPTATPVLFQVLLRTGVMGDLHPSPLLPRVAQIPRRGRIAAQLPVRFAAKSLVRGSDDSVVDVKSYPIVDVVGGAYIGKEARLVKRTKERV